MAARAEWYACYPGIAILERTSYRQILVGFYRVNYYRYGLDCNCYSCHIMHYEL
jgi:hypothetical protein